MSSIRSKIPVGTITGSVGEMLAGKSDVASPVLPSVMMMRYCRTAS